MLYRTFGRTGLRMPVLSAGFMRAMQSWQDCEAASIERTSQETMEAVVQAALKHGINHFETARGYGTSERQLGQAIKTLQRDTFILQTKVTPEPDPEVFTRKVLDSLARLQVDRVDLLALHGINTYRDLWMSCRPGGCLAAARQLQRQGRAGWIGFSSHGLREVILAAVAHAADGGFDYVNLHWYAIFQRHAPVLEMAQTKNLGVFIISPTDKGGRLHDPPEQLKALSQPFSPMQFNDLFCLSRPEIHTISVGAARPPDFDEHVEALPHLAQSALIEAVVSRWQAAMFAVTGQQQPDSHWDQFPSYFTTPGYINIAFILWLENLAKGWGLHGYARDRYALLGKEMGWVPGNSAACLEGLDLSEAAAGAAMSGQDLIARLREAHRLLAGT